MKTGHITNQISELQSHEQKLISSRQTQSLRNVTSCQNLSIHHWMHSVMLWAMLYDFCSSSRGTLTHAGRVSHICPPPVCSQPQGLLSSAGCFILARWLVHTGQVAGLYPPATEFTVVSHRVCDRQLAESKPSASWFITNQVAAGLSNCRSRHLQFLHLRIRQFTYTCNNDKS